MQSKGAIRFLAIALAIVCLYQLSFTLVSNYWDNKAEEIAAKDTAQAKVFLDSMATAPAYNLLIKKYTLNEVRDREINLGLDLKGGMNVTLEVSMIDLVRSLSNYSKDGTFNKALDMAQKAAANSQKDFVDRFYDAFIQLDPNARLSAIFATKDLQNRINLSTSNSDVLKVIKEEEQNAFDRTYQIIQTRIDKFGVTSPNVQKLGANRIMVELPGIKEPDRVRKLLQGTAKLEFWETFENEQIYPALDTVNRILRVTAPADTTAPDSAQAAAAPDTLTPDSAALAAAKPDTGTTLEEILGNTKTDTGANASAGDTLQKSFEEIARENPLFAYLTPWVDRDNRLMQGPVIGVAQIKDTARINSILNLEMVKARFPKEFKALWMVKPFDDDKKYLQLVAIRMPPRSNTAPLEGDAITDARKQKGQFSNDWEISMNMNSAGAKTWKKLTRDNIKKSIAIVLDNNVYSFPTVQGEIPGGTSQITGDFDVKEAEDLANILKVGKLPAPAKIVEESIVGPTLGQEAISNSLISFIVAFIVILLFMGLYYMKAGWVANLALFANIFFIMGVLASLQAVLTLPGIAGIILTIGLSVDANILIFERVREELRHGKGVRLAIADGFKHAMSSILDSNITLLILGIVLFLFGSGPIQGFATTLIIGILCSLFAAVLISRLIFEGLLEKNKPITFSNNFSENLYKGVHFDFVRNRKKYYIFSTLVIIAGIVAYSMKGGFHFGVDFKGGRTYIVQMDKPLHGEDLRKALAVNLESPPEVKTVGTENRFKITTSYLINDTSSNVENILIERLHSGLTPLYNKAPDYETFKSTNLISSQKVGPTIADDIKRGAVWAILISCALMFFYIFFRFKKWQFGLGATVALFHDVLFVLACYAILDGVIPIALEIDQHFIAAILTVMGYTMTESVIVFDRIREFLGVHHTADDKTVINEALNATLSRTINTTLTVFFVLVVIFIFGGEVIRGFVFALLIGRIIGTYSSLCISTPIVIDFQRKKEGQIAKGMATPPKAAVKEQVN